MKTSICVRLLIIVLLVCPLNLMCSAFTTREVTVSQSVTLRCVDDCRSDVEWTRFLPDKTKVAHCVKGRCRVEPAFQKRISFTENTSLLFSSVVYNDIGSYRCSCGKETAEIKLKVFVPTVVTVRETDIAQLPCCGDTRDAKDVQWKKGEQRVLLYDHDTGKMTYGRGFEERLTLSPGFLDGNLYLNITSVGASDEGLYLCTIHDESREGEPRAVLLKVEVSKSESTFSECCVGCGVAIGLTIAAAAAAIGCAVYCLRRNRRPQDIMPSATHPVQELSSSTESEHLKSSSTLPFQD